MNDCLLKLLILKTSILKKRKNEGGFTLIELLVVILIIGILASIALPSFLNQANKAVESEARSYLASINEAQDAEYNSDREFGDLDELNISLGLNNQGCSADYCYTITTSTGGNGLAQAVTIATPVNQNGGIIAAAGKIYLRRNAENEVVSDRFICESLDSQPPNLASATECPAGSQPIRN